MILSRDFTFIHIPKTGGIFVREICRDYAPKEWYVTVLDGHPTVEDIPEELRGLPRVTIVRNPYDWYVSWYAYLLHERKDKFFQEVSGEWTRGFKETLLAVFDSDRLRDTGVGQYTLHVQELFGETFDSAHVIRFESLRKELVRVLKKLSDPPPAMIRAIKHQPKSNTSDRGRYRSYYDDELRDLVATRERMIIERFGYKF